MGHQKRTSEAHRWQAASRITGWIVLTLVFLFGFFTAALAGLMACFLASGGKGF